MHDNLPKETAIMLRYKTTILRFFVFTTAFLVVGLASLVCLAQMRRRAAETGVSVSFQHDGRQREYRIHVPESVKSGRRVPLVLCFHGGGGNSGMASAMGLTTVADRESFIVVYPNAIKKHWNDGRDSPMFADQDRTVDDVAFVMDVIESVCAQHPIDRDRIFATGLSNGGFMSQRLAMEKPEMFAGIGVVIATMGEPISKTFAPKMPVSVLYLNGTEDRLMPYGGGAVGTGLFNRGKPMKDAPRGRAISTDKAVALWVQRNQTTPQPRLKMLADVDQNDGSQIEYSLWENGERGTAVALYKVIGGGHGLPGGVQYLPARVIGRANQDVKGFDIIWEFFQNHARRPVNETAAPGSVVASAKTAESSKVSFSGVEQQLVFPTSQWETVSPGAIGVNAKSLDAALDFAMQRKSSSIVVSVGGKILAQQHTKVPSPGFLYRRSLHGETEDGHQIEDVASVQKSVTSVLVGIALGKNLLRLDDPVQEHLGQGWSGANNLLESKIKLQHLLTMTTGLDDKLNYVSPPGTQWKYNTQAYQQMMEVVAKAAGSSRNELTRKWLAEPLGMNDSEWVSREKSGQAFTSSALDLTRFGLLMLSNGQWNDQDIVNHHEYLDAATSPSQKLNPSYGYLWWLNGQEFVIRPGLGKTMGPCILSAPSDLFAAEGALGRKVYVVPSMQLVVTRLGDRPEVRGRPKFDEKFWDLLMKAFH